MGWIERGLVIAALCVLTGIGWQLGSTAPASSATVGLVSVRSGSVAARPASSTSGSSRSHRSRRRVYVGGGFHGGK